MTNDDIYTLHFEEVPNVCGERHTAEQFKPQMKNNEKKYQIFQT